MPDVNKPTHPSAAKATNGSQNSPDAGAKSSSPRSAVEQLKADHRKVEALFASFERASESEKSRIIEQLCHELIIHTLIEEQVFYPACRKAASDKDALNEAQVEHDGAKVLVADLMRGEQGDPYRDAKVKVLSEEIKHHVAEEEKPSTGILAKATADGVDTPDLAQRLLETKQSLQARGDNLPSPRLVSLKPPSQSREDPMFRDIGERDERGRFAGDDYDDRRGRANASRDEEGRFASRGRPYDDDRRPGGGRGERGWEEPSRYGSRGGEDDRRQSRGRDEDDRRSGGQGGWFGDRGGHSEASRRGWEEREGASRDDDERRYGRGRDDEGRFSSRRSRDDDDRRSGGRSHGGWFGDPEGHSRASERGWEERSPYSSRSDDDDRRPSRGRDDDDRRSGGRDHGGWFGDSRGHSQASREGWDRRR